MELSTFSSTVEVPRKRFTEIPAVLLGEEVDAEKEVMAMLGKTVEKMEEMEEMEEMEKMEKMEEMEEMEKMEEM